VGVDIRYVSMLRHPAEVVGSRTTYYAGSRDEAGRLRYQTASVARWVNSTLITERETRGERRAFVLYPDLLEDWRGVFRTIEGPLGLRLNADLGTREPHPVDDFIDPALRRHQVSWDEIEIPASLRVVADDVWEAVSRLSRDQKPEGDPSDPSRVFDALSARYTQLFRESVAISHDAMVQARDDARRAGAQEALAKAESTGLGPTPARLEDRPLRDVSGRELLRAAGQRLTGRLRRR
jgi:hypothetical protein